MDRRRKVLAALATIGLAVSCDRYNDPNGGEIHTDPRTLDRICAAGGCKSTGSVVVVDGLTEGTLAYAFGPAPGALELDLTDTLNDFRGYDAGAGQTGSPAKAGASGAGKGGAAASAGYGYAVRTQFQVLVVGSGSITATCKGCEPIVIYANDTRHWFSLRDLPTKLTLTSNEDGRAILHDVRFTEQTDAPGGCSLSPARR